MSLKKRRNLMKGWTLCNEGHVGLLDDDRWKDFEQTDLADEQQN